MDDILELVLGKGVTMESNEAGLKFSTGVLSRTYPEPSKGMQKVLDVLKHTGASENQLMDIVLEEEGFDGLMGFTYMLKTIDSMGFLNYQFSLDGSRVRWVPLSSKLEYQKFDPVEGVSYKLSKFSLLRKSNDSFVFECPLGKSHVEFSDPAISQLILSLYDPIVPENWKNEQPQKNELLHQLLEFLFNTNSLQALTSDGKLKEDDLGNSEAYWEFHDLYFHSRSRLGRHNNAYGGTFPFGDKTVVPPAFKTIEGKSRIDLYKPSIDKLKKTDVTLTHALEERKSIREHGDEPITDRQLGEFLYRTNRVTEVVKQELFEYAKKIYPAGGGLYELEIYPVITNCDGIESGMYYYDSKEHQLVLLREPDDEMHVLAGLSAKTAAMEGLPQVTLVITARFQRLMHKYRSVAYALILKHVGVLYQQMYLVATGMHLAPCALGGGDADRFSELVGLNYLEESSVGEFLLGSRNDD